jgi:hypothetical protein
MFEAQLRTISLEVIATGRMLEVRHPHFGGAESTFHQPGVSAAARSSRKARALTTSLNNSEFSPVFVLFRSRRATV